MFLPFLSEILEGYLYVMAWGVFNKIYVQILDKIVQFISHTVFDGHYVGTTVSTASGNFQH